VLPFDALEGLAVTIENLTEIAVEMKKGKPALIYEAQDSLVKQGSEARDDDKSYIVPRPAITSPDIKE
jgi:hypothetical protein